MEVVEGDRDGLLLGKDGKDVDDEREEARPRLLGRRQLLDVGRARAETKERRDLLELWDGGM
jgi:hypothetical protein